MPQCPVAIDPRVQLAQERTLLAWVRTGLALMGFGFVVARFGVLLREIGSGYRAAAGVAADAAGAQPPGGTSVWIGAVLVGLGVVVHVVAAWQHVRRLRRLAAGDALIPAPAFGVAVSLVLALIGVGMTAYLFRLPSP